MAMEQVSLREAFKQLGESYFPDKHNTAVRADRRFIYEYRDLEGRPVFRKNKIINAEGETKWWTEYYENGS
jgi:hypothetical protein